MYQQKIKQQTKLKKITITNDKGRLSEEEIQKMVEKAKQMEEEDAKILGKVNAKNALEGFLFQVKNSVSDKQLEGKIPDEDKEKILSTVDGGIKWLEQNGADASKEDIEKKQKEIEEVVNPILQKLGGGMGGQGGMGGGMNFNPEDFQNFNQGGKKDDDDKKEDEKPSFQDLDVD